MQNQVRIRCVKPVGERLGAPAFLFEVFSGGASPSPTVRKERANHGAKRSYPSAQNGQSIFEENTDACPYNSGG